MSNQTWGPAIFYKATIHFFHLKLLDGSEQTNSEINQIVVSWKKPAEG